MIFQNIISLLSKPYKMQNKYISIGFSNILYLIIILNLFACKQSGDQNAIYNISKSVTSTALW